MMYDPYDVITNAVVMVTNTVAMIDMSPMQSSWLAVACHG